MKLFPILLAVVLIVAAGTTTPALAMDKEFTAVPGNNHWNYGPNWDPEDVPDSDDNAIILAGQVCYITDADAVADSIEIKVDGESKGELWVYPERKLSLYGDADSDIDGLLHLSGTLVIMSDLSITGEAGKIEMFKNSVIDDDENNGAVLTLEHACDPELQPDCAVTVFGVGYIKVTLVNDAFVVADGTCDEMTLHLIEESKSGSGVWEAKNLGWLEVNLAEGEEFTGSGTWRILATAANDGAMIFIKSCIDGLTGDVEIKNGKFEAEESFCTTGDLTWESVAGSPYNTEPEFYVHSAKTAMFVESCSNVCP